MDWIRRLVGSMSDEAGTPPSPDVTTTPRFLAEDVLEVVYSSSQRYREVITRDRAGRFRVHDERWAVEDWDVAGEAFWVPYDRTATITDTIENARKLAAEALVAVEPPRREEDDE